MQSTLKRPGPFVVFWNNAAYPLSTNPGVPEDTSSKNINYGRKWNNFNTSSKSFDVKEEAIAFWIKLDSMAQKEEKFQQRYPFNLAKNF